MYARLTTFDAPPENVQRAVDAYREHALPWLRDATGFRGWIVLLDRERGEAVGLTFWTDEETMRDSVASGGALRDEIAEAAETPMRSLRGYEVLAAEALDLGS
ncbi:MAG: antibiotic biosynthesis monooxygenase [Pseudomonadota bacterium]